ncbi:MAG: M14 family metallopeptidase [Nitrospira sp.]|nr:M14 family metallopeptidase [Nitrospira sp.]
MATVRLTTLEQVPAPLYDAPVTSLADILEGPTLLHLPGRNARPLFVSVLLHGNEITGWHAIQQLLRKYRKALLPRALSVFIGNVAAARHGLRRLEGQPDYNRLWPGGESPGCAESAAAPSLARGPRLDPIAESAILAEVVAQMRARSVFASIDVHNNTGLNPHYACVNRLDRPFLHLATLFSRIVVYFTEPAGVQSAAFAPLCPSVTIECGKPGAPGAAAHAAEFIDAALHLAEFPQHGVAAHDIDLYHTVATVKIPDEVTISFDGSPADLEFVADLDHLNFRELAPGTPLARVRLGCPTPVAVPDGTGGNRWREFLAVRDGWLVFARALMPSMLTRDARVVRQDCLGYLMERLAPPH